MPSLARVRDVATSADQFTKGESVLDVAPETTLAIVRFVFHEKADGCSATGAASSIYRRYGYCSSINP